MIKIYPYIRVPPPGAASGRPVAAGGAEGGRVPPSRLPAVRWWCGSPSP